MIIGAAIHKDLFFKILSDIAVFLIKGDTRAGYPITVWYPDMLQVIDTKSGLIKTHSFPSLHGLRIIREPIRLLKGNKEAGFSPVKIGYS